MAEVGAPLLRIEDLTVALPSWADRPHAVEDLSLTIYPDEILCVVGESGSGKSVTARAILRLLPEPHVRPVGGRILFEGENLLQATQARMRQVRGGRIAMIFQEPMTALNPVMKIGRQIEEMVEIHLDMSAAARRQRILDLLRDVHLPDPERLLATYPHELSGGQRQRAMIAMALVLEPAILVADEPTTALDVTTQAQILALIKELHYENTCDLPRLIRIFQLLTVGVGDKIFAYSRIKKYLGTTQPRVGERRYKCQVLESPQGSLNNRSIWADLSNRLSPMHANQRA